jgi:CID domain
LRNVAQSTARVTGLGKYLTALSTSFTEPGNPSITKAVERQPSVKRKRLYLLYLINDLLHHAKVHSNDASLSSKIQPSLVDLLSSAASFTNTSKHQRKLHSLLDIWEHKQYYSAEYIAKLREAARLALEGGESTDASRHSDSKVDMVSKSSRSIPFMMPAMHGDQGTPWYDLPAANLMPHIVPNSARPINPELVKPLRFIAGPADETLANAVRELLREANDKFEATQSHGHFIEPLWDIDELGQTILRDDMTGEILSGEGYYGWSKAFCEKMKRRRKGLAYTESSSYRESDRRGRSRSQTRSLSRTSSRSSQPHKRRRYSDSDEDRSRNRSRSISRRRRRTWSSSRSASIERGISSQLDKPDETIQRSPSQGRGNHSARDRSHSSHSDFQEHSRYSAMYAQDSQNFSQSQHALIFDTSHSFNANIIPIPPPPPPQYQGTWPPPHPPPIVRYGQQGGSWPPTAPPFLHGAQQWPSTPYGQPQAGGNTWPQTRPQESSSSEAYGVQGQSGSTVPQQQYSAGVSGYNGYGGTGRGRGRGWSK